MHRKSLEKLDSWIRQNGWAGYDPYDIKGKPPFLLFSKSKYTAFAAHNVLRRFPMVTRKLFRVKKEVNAKAMALMARAYLRMFKTSGDESYKKLAMECLEWLNANFSPNYSGKCWGYPFDWQGRTFIPKGTPSIVVSSIAAHTFLYAYEILGEKKYLDVARSTCDFIMNDLNRDENENTLCFSYTPADNWHVHNANLFGASVLARVGAFTREDELKKLAIKSINFTMNHQNDDGSFYYWAPPTPVDKLFKLIDNYHTGFVLESLNVCRRALGSDFKCDKELKKGLDFYARELFTETGEALISTKDRYPINIHSCAQGIITFIELADFDATHKMISKKVADWTIENMQDSSGYFYHLIDGKGYVDKMPYIRWGQAWMLLALSYLVKVEAEK